jgi:hypothetical protein
MESINTGCYPVQRCFPYWILVRLGGLLCPVQLGHQNTDTPQSKSIHASVSIHA